MLSWLRKSLGMTPATDPVALTNVGHGGFNFEVVGEQSYQSHLRKLSGGRVERGERVVVGCRLRYEINAHTHGPAVRVDVNGVGKVAYFPAEQAAIYASAFYELERGGHVAECQGVLVGGQPDKPSFGIYLDFKPKLLSLQD
jgi:hypothetical protein